MSTANTSGPVTLRHKNASVSGGLFSGAELLTLLLALEHPTATNCHQLLAHMAAHRQQAPAAPTTASAPPLQAVEREKL